MQLLLMEDDPVLSDILLDFLRESYSVDYAFNAVNAFELIQKQHYDLFIFDINVPGQSGLKFLKELRDFDHMTPAIIITAYSDMAHLTQAFNAGAHDYIKKPFDLEELHARIENSRRIFNIEHQKSIHITETIMYDPANHQLIDDDVTHTLSSKESEILHYFLMHPDRTISNNELTQNLWDYENIPTDATIRSHIRRLRELIGKESLQTVRGVGYYFKRSQP